MAIYMSKPNNHHYLH